jgi:hypothetical protein
MAFSIQDTASTGYLWAAIWAMVCPVTAAAVMASSTHCILMAQVSTTVVRMPVPRKAPGPKPGPLGSSPTLPRATRSSRSAQKQNSVVVHSLAGVSGGGGARGERMRKRGGEGEVGRNERRRRGGGATGAWAWANSQANQACAAPALPTPTVPVVSIIPAPHTPGFSRCSSSWAVRRDTNTRHPNRQEMVEAQGQVSSKWRGISRRRR